MSRDWREGWRRERAMRHATALAFALPFQERSYWLRRFDAEGSDAIPAFSSWLTRGEPDVPAT